MIKNKFNNSISILKKAIDNDKLVVFAGAGISKDSGMPLWSELIKYIKGALNNDIKEDDPLKIAQMLYNEKGEKEYSDIIRNSLFKNKGNYNPLHEIIFDLNPQHIITTNYDNYFENVIENKGLPFSVVSKDIDLPYAEHKNLLIKYHGDFENKNIVFKEADYLEFSKNHTLKEVFVKSLFSNKIVLFIGYSVNDINLKLLIREIQFILNKHHQRAYLLSHKHDMPESEIIYFENLGINIINYCEDSLKSIKGNSNLSPVGEAVYKQLKYLYNFKPFEYEKEKIKVDSKIKVSKVIDDLYSSFNRFHYFRVLPKTFLASLYPLNKDSKNNTIYNIESTTLVCYNTELYSILENYKGKEDNSLREEEKLKINFCLERLMYSNIYYLGKKMGPKDSLGNRKTEDKLNLLDKHYSDKKDCDCIECTIGNFRYSDAISKIEIYEITDKSILWDDLIYAYSLCQLEEYFKAYNAYENIKLKAYKNKQMDVAFLCLYNIKRIAKFIKSAMIFDERYSFEDLDEIENSAEKIDLDKELIKLKYFVDEDVFNFLKEIRYGKNIQILCNNIENLFNKVTNEVKLIKNGGASINSNYSLLYNTVKELTNYLEGNFIIGNGFTAITRSINNSIKTFILGYYIGTLKISSYQKSFGISKLESFNEFMFLQIMNYEDYEDLYNFIIDHNIYDIKFDERSEKIVAKHICNFLSSAYKYNKYIGKQKNDLYINYLKYNRSFNNKISRQFKTICIVLTFFEFSEPQIKKIYSDLNEFIKNTNLYIDNKYLQKFIFKKYEIIGFELLKETLQIINNKKDYDILYITILQTIKELDLNFITSDICYDNLDFDKVNPNFHLIYESIPVEQKKDLVIKLNKYLEEKFDEKLIYVLLLEKIPINNSLKNKYIKYIHKILSAIIDLSENDNLYNKINNYFELIYLGIIVDPKLSSLSLNSELVKFIIAPESYDKDKFEVEWLNTFYKNIFIKRFSKISYIIEKLENYLIANNDERLNKVYFKIKSESNKKDY